MLIVLWVYGKRGAFVSIEKIYLKGINPTLPTVYDDGLSYMEAIAKLQYKINECINLLNETDFEGFKQALQDTVNYVDNKMVVVDSKLAKQMQEVVALINDNNSYNRKLIEMTLVEISKTIEEKSLEVTATNPLTGKPDVLNKVIGVTDSICRNTGLIANAYDNVGLSADEFEEMCYDYDVNAFMYDVYGLNSILEFLGGMLAPNPELPTFSYNVHISPYSIDVSFADFTGYDGLEYRGKKLPLFYVGEKLMKILNSVTGRAIGFVTFSSKLIIPSYYPDVYPIYFDRQNNQIYLSPTFSTHYFDYILGNDSSDGGSFRLNLVNLNQLYSYN